MGKAYPMEVRLKAQELFCVLRWTLEAVGEEIGVAYTTVQRWSQKYGWQEMQDKLAQAQFDIKADSILARAEMLTTLIKTKDPQAAFAVSSLETLAMKQAEAERAGKIFDAAVGDTPEIKTTDDMAAALREAVTQKLSNMLSDTSQVDLKAVADIQKASKIIEEMESKPKNDDPGTGNGVSADNLDKMLDALK